jgi:hypothetical protein
MMADLLSKDVWLVVLGAVLALMASVAMVFVQRKVNEGRTRRLLKILLHHEIETITDSLDRLIQESAIAGFIPLLRITAIQNIRQGYDRNRDWLILFPPELQRDVFDFYTRLHIALTDAQGMENLALDPRVLGIPNWLQTLTTERKRLLTSFGDLAATGRALLPRLDKA